MRNALIGVGVVMAVSSPIAATDVTGLWSLELSPDFGGNDDTVGCSFLQEKENLTINCGAGPNITGEVRGRSVTFRVPTGSNNEISATFVGDLDQSETAISGTWRLPENQRGPREGKFLAKKTSDTY